MPVQGSPRTTTTGCRLPAAPVSPGAARRVPCGRTGARARRRPPGAPQLLRRPLPSQAGIPCHDPIVSRRPKAGDAIWPMVLSVMTAIRLGFCVLPQRGGQHWRDDRPRSCSSPAGPRPAWPPPGDELARCCRRYGCARRPWASVGSTVRRTTCPPWGPGRESAGRCSQAGASARAEYMCLGPGVGNLERPRPAGPSASWPWCVLPRSARPGRPDRRRHHRASACSPGAGRGPAPATGMARRSTAAVLLYRAVAYCPHPPRRDRLPHLAARASAYSRQARRAGHPAGMSPPGLGLAGEQHTPRRTRK